MPIVTIEADDKQALEIAIIENVQRSNLNALEEAQGYERLGAEFGYSQGDLAKVIGKSRPHVNNTLRLLKLPEHTRALLSSGQTGATPPPPPARCGGPPTPPPPPPPPAPPPPTPTRSPSRSWPRDCRCARSKRW